MAPINDEERYGVLGLGNPGPTYAGNRHNVGFMVVDLLAERMDGRFKSGRLFSRLRSDVCEGRLGGVPVVLAKPRSFMNESGGPVSAVANYYRIPRERLVVVHDELDLDFDRLRLKQGGGDNGHNGLRSIGNALSGRDYFRVRVGIGRPPGRQDPATYVLRDFSTNERRELPFLLDRAADAVESLLSRGLAVAQQEFNS